MQYYNIFTNIWYSYRNIVKIPISHPSLAEDSAADYISIMSQHNVNSISFNSNNEIQSLFQRDAISSIHRAIQTEMLSMSIIDEIKVCKYFICIFFNI